MSVPGEAIEFVFPDGRRFATPRPAQEFLDGLMREPKGSLHDEIERLERTVAAALQVALWRSAPAQMASDEMDVSSLFDPESVSFSEAQEIHCAVLCSRAMTAPTPSRVALRTGSASNLRRSLASLKAQLRSGEQPPAPTASPA